VFEKFKLKMTSKAAKVYGSALIVGAAFYPTQAFAAEGDFLAKSINFVDTLINYLLVLCPSTATLAVMWFAFQAKMSGDRGKKSDNKDHIKSTIIYGGLIMMAGVFIKFCFNAFA
jgi:hypothetical protein